MSATPALFAFRAKKQHLKFNYLSPFSSNTARVEFTGMQHGNHVNLIISLLLRLRPTLNWTWAGNKSYNKWYDAILLVTFHTIKNKRFGWKLPTVLWRAITFSGLENGNF